MARKTSRKYADNRQAITEGMRLAEDHPLIQPLPDFDLETDESALKLDQDMWLQVACDPPRPRFGQGGPEPEPLVTVRPNLRRRLPASEWAYVFARVRLHIALNHLDPARRDTAWHLATWFIAEEIISVAGIGQRPAGFPPLPSDLPRGSEEKLAEFVTTEQAPADLLTLSLGKPGQAFWAFSSSFTISEDLKAQRRGNLAKGIRAAASAAVDVAGGARKTLGREKSADTVVKRARDWVIAEFPLLAALASSFRLIEDQDLCQAMDVAVAAISDEAQEIYVNPKVKFNEDEARFVMAHELLHAGLRHSARRQGRDPWFWNVSCDFVINDWLIEMRVSAPPDRIGYLHDPGLRGLSAEEVYDRIVSDLRWMRKLRKARTLNGDSVDILEGRHPPGWWRGGGVDLDAFYRRALTDGLELHLGRGRGYLPAGLIEEIRSLMQPPIPWDVELAHWLDQFFPPLERRRSYARAHRRQSATPDIPRPAWVAPDDQRSARVFAAVVDTSGSMSRGDLGKAIGAIASYAMSRDVGYVRMIQCDAAAHDAGYIEPEALLEQVQVKGRGGTVLRPGIKLLEEARDFPDDGPILIITDGACDRLTVRHDHAFLLAAGGRLPFQPKGPVFRFA